MDDMAVFLMHHITEIRREQDSRGKSNSVTQNSEMMVLVGGRRNKEKKDKRQSALKYMIPVVSLFQLSPLIRLNDLINRMETRCVV